MKRLFTLIELIIVIVVLGILAVILIPSISSMKDKAIKTAITNDIVNVQTAVDMQFTNEGELPIEKEVALGEPQEINFDKIVPEYLRSVPKQGNFWLDDNQTVHGSVSELPFSQLSDSGLLSWDKTEGAEEYIVYEDSNKTTSNASNPLLKVIQKGGFEKNEVGRYYFEGDKNKNYYLSSVDKYGNETPVVGSNFVAISGLEVDVLVKEEGGKSTLSIKPKSEDGVQPYKYTYNGETHTGNNLELNFFESQTVEITAHFENGEIQEVSVYVEVLDTFKEKTISLEEKEGSEQTQTFTVKNLNEIKNITSKDGNVKIISVDGDKVTVKLSGNENFTTKKVSGEYIPEDTKTVKFTRNYNQERIRIRNNDFEIDLTTDHTGEYFGNLTRKVVGATDIKYKTGIYRDAHKETVEECREYKNNEWVESQGCADTVLKGFVRQDNPDNYVGQTLLETSSNGDKNFNNFTTSYEEGNEKITVNRHFADWSRGEIKEVIYDEPIIEDPIDNIKNPKEGDVVGRAYKYYGHYELDILTYLTPDSNGKLNSLIPLRWEYEGEVTRPAKDTRVYKNFYQYDISIEYR